MIEQIKRGYRFSIEPFLLADFASVRNGNKILDIGTGSGVIPILLSKTKSDLEIIAVEIQKLLSDLAFKNVQSAGLSAVIEIIYGDFLEVSERLQLESFDMVLSNPPYRKLNSGRINPNIVKAISRHEIKLKLRNIVETSFRLLRANGKIVLSYPISRKREVLGELIGAKLIPKRLLNIYGHSGTIAKFFLVEAEKSRIVSPIKEDAICIYKSDGSFSENMERVYASFNYPCRSHRIRQKLNSSGISR